MMSLKPRNVDFQETWANLKETVAGVVGLRAVERSVWNTRFSDVYALCVAHPEPLADRLYDETKSFLEEHVSTILRRVAGSSSLEGGDPEDGLLARYVNSWREYSQGAAYLNCLYSYLNLQHVKRQKVSDAEVIYGGAAHCDHDARQLEVGELALEIWERVLLGALGSALSARIVAALSAARDTPLETAKADILRAAVHSTVQVRAFRARGALALYARLVLEPFLSSAAAHHARAAAALLSRGDMADYMRQALAGLDREVSLARRFLHAGSQEAVRTAYEREYVAAHLPALHAEVPRLLKEAGAALPGSEPRADLRRLHALLAPLGAQALRPLVAAAHSQAAAEGHAADYGTEEPHVKFVEAMLALHDKYSRLFADVFDGAQVFVGALDKACSEVVNARSGAGPARAPELLARYCDCLLRRRGAEPDNDDRLAAAITVFKYVDDKDVFQKHYARALARRLIHQLSASMEQEEAMINRLKAACGYEFTNKLHRMFTDVAVSADLNTKFQAHVRSRGIALAGFAVQVLQAGAWPLGGAMAPLAPPLQLERPARLFEAFYRAAFSGRRLAWLHHLCTGELRTRYTPRVYHVTAGTHQCALLLAFEDEDRLPARELRAALQLPDDAWPRHLRPLLDQGLLNKEGDVESPGAECSGTLSLNLAFSCKRTRVRLQAAGGGAAPAAGGSAPAEPATCDDDRKMYLQAAIVRIMKQRKVLRHTELIQEVVSQARASFAPSVAMIKKCIEALIDKQYLERTPAALDTYSYLA